MRVSVAMTTYNGEKYLSEQLESILNQSQTPDQMIICDDGSSDNTLKILSEFKDKAQFKVEVIENETNLGFDDNFKKVIALCTEDLIFISDQDDYWFPEKIKTMTNLMQENIECFIAVNDTEVTDSNLYPLGLSKIDQVEKYQGTHEGFIPGCCTVFRGDYLQLVLPFSSKMAYDSWLHFIGINTNSRIVYKKYLQYYRRHGANSTNHPVNSTNQIYSINRYVAIVKRLFKTKKNKARESYIQLNYKLAKELRKRIKDLESKTNDHVIRLNSRKMNKHLDTKIHAYKYILKLSDMGVLRKIPYSFILLFWRKLSLREFMFVYF